MNSHKVVAGNCIPGILLIFIRNDEFSSEFDIRIYLNYSGIEVLSEFGFGFGKDWKALYGLHFELLVSFYLRPFSLNSSRVVSLI